MATAHHHHVRKLASLDDWELEHPDQDLRGKMLVDHQGQEVGIIDDMLADTDKEKIVALRLRDDRIVNVDAVDIRDGRPVLTMGREGVPKPAAGVDRGAVTAEHIPIVEERMKVGTRAVELGKVRVRTRTVSENVSEDVKLRDEHVNVERRAVPQTGERTVSAAEANTLFADNEIELTETGERVVVDKKAVVTGEVVVSKDVDTRTERVEGTVRHTEVDVDRDRDAKRR